MLTITATAEPDTALLSSMACQRRMHANNPADKQQSWMHLAQAYVWLATSYVCLKTVSISCVKDGTDHI